MTVEEKHMVFDQWDPSADHYLQQKQQTENDFQDRKLDNLKQIYGGQIERAHNHSDSRFAGHIKEKTGYDIEAARYLFVMLFVWSCAGTHGLRINGKGGKEGAKLYGYHKLLVL